MQQETQHLPVISHGNVRDAYQSSAALPSHDAGSCIQFPLAPAWVCCHIPHFPVMILVLGRVSTHPCWEHLLSTFRTSQSKFMHIGPKQRQFIACRNHVITQESIPLLWLFAVSALPGHLTVQGATLSTSRSVPTASIRKSQEKTVQRCLS